MLMRLFRSFRWFIDTTNDRIWWPSSLLSSITDCPWCRRGWSVDCRRPGLSDLGSRGFLRLILLLLLPIVALYIVNYVWNIRLLKGGDVISRVTRRRLMEKFRRQGPIFMLNIPSVLCWGRRPMMYWRWRTLRVTG